MTLYYIIAILQIISSNFYPYRARAKLTRMKKNWK